MGSKKASGTKPRTRGVSPGVQERHTKECASSRSSRRACDCVPSFRARIRTGSRGGQTTITESFGTLAEAVDWIADARRLQRSGEHPAPPKQAPTFGKAGADFFARARAGKALNRSGKTYAATTIGNYETVVRVHALPFISGRNGRPLKELPADTITTRTLQALVNHLQAEKSAAVARLTEAAVTAVLRDLYARELLDQVPARPVLPAPPKGRDRHLTVDQGDALLKAAQEDDADTGRSLMAPLVAALLATGCRITEVLGLTWGPAGIDLKAKTITIARDTTKSDAGARTVGIEAEYLQALRAHALATGRPKNGTHVFTNERGEPLTRDGRVRSGLRRLRKTTGVDFTAHVLRHTQGSQLAAAGYSATEIAARLGHADPSFTMRRYVHADDAKTAEEPEALAAYRAEQRRAVRDKG